MKSITFSPINLVCTHTGFGALPIQRVEMDEAARILRRAYDAGITFYDTARGYSNSEEKIGIALSNVRKNIVIATKTPAQNADGFWRDLDTSLQKLKTDYIDIYQFHNPKFVPLPGGEDGLYDAMIEARQQGKIRAIGITQHSLDGAKTAIESGLYDTLQYPFNHLATDAEVEMVRECGRRGMGFIAMKALSGGLVTDASAPFAFLRQFEHVIPIWGIQKMEELEEFIRFDDAPPMLNAQMEERIARDRKELSGSFCRGCGYCMPCPVGIPIAMANRMEQLLMRSPTAGWMSEEWQANMEKIALCTGCGACEKKCPYDLKPYETMPAHLEFYRKMAAAQ